jgi:hypothetical protein
VNTLDNARIEVDAGRCRIVSSPDSRYLEWGPWVAFEAALRDRLEFPADGPQSLQQWATVGQKICQLHFAVRQRSAKALKLREELVASLPAAMKADAAADWTAFPVRVR